MKIPNEQLRQAIDRAGADDTTPFARQLKKRLETGKFDKQLKEIGFKRTVNGLKPFESFGSRVSNVIEERGANAAQAIQGEGEFEDRSTLGRGVGAASEAFSAVGDVAFEAIPEKGREILGKVGEKVGQGFDAVVNKLSDTQLFQEAAQSGNTGKIEEVLKILADTGNIAGQVAGAAETAGVLSKAGTSATSGVTKIRQAVSDSNIKSNATNAVRKALRTSPEGLDVAAQQSKLVDTIKDSVIGSKRGINNNLEKLAQRNGRTVDDLLTELVEEGGLPDLKDDAVDYSDFLNATQSTNKAISETINKRVKQLTEQTSIEDLKSSVTTRLQDTRAIAGDLDKINREVERLFNSYQKKYGDALSPDNINEIRVESNKFFKEAFETDARRAIGDATRNRISEIDNTVTEALEQQSRLFRVENTAKALNRQKVSVNEYVKSLGGFTGSVLAGAGGITALAGGPAGLLIAGLAAKFGGQIFAKALRKKKFSPEVFDLIKESLNKNPAILEDLLKSVGDEDGALLRSRLLPAAGESSFEAPVIELPTRGNVPKGLGDEPGFNQ